MASQSILPARPRPGEPRGAALPTEPAAVGSAPRRSGGTHLWRLIVLAVLLAVWELAAGRLIEPFWVSQPSRIFARVLELTASGLLFVHVWATLQAALWGLVTGTVAAVLGGLLLGARPRLAEVLDPFLMGFNSLPRVALGPLFIIWFGIGLPSKVLLAFSLVFFPALINTYQGIRSVDRELIDVMRTMQASSLQIARWVIVPSTLPWIFAGVRIGLGMSLIGAVVGELVGANRGVGYYIEASSANFDTTGVFTGLLVLMAITIVLNECMKVAEARLFRWRPPQSD